MTQTLEALRAEIDGIDDALFALIKKRSKIVARVGEYKKAHEEGIHNIRPGREAEMLRRVVESFKDSHFSAVSAASIWRLIIGASTSIEVPLSFSVLANNEEKDAYWLTREYFGCGLPIHKHPTTNRVLGDVLDGKVTAAILPWPKQDEKNPWWLTLSEQENPPKIFAVLPFVTDGKKDAPCALAVGRIKPEPTGRDVTLLLITTDHDTSTHRLQTVFAKTGLSAQWISIIPGKMDTRKHLVQVNSFVTEGEMIKSFLAEIGHGVTVQSLGAFAQPIIMKENYESRS